MTVAENLASIVAAIGKDKAADLCLTLGGTIVYLGQDPAAETLVGRAIGSEAAAALARALGPGQHRVPTARRFIAGQLKARQLTVRQIARTLHADEWTVRRWLAAAPHDQPTLL
jgi:hypothetical protein